MSLEQSGSSSWFSRFRSGKKSNRRKAVSSAHGFNRRAWVEQLEERRLLVSRVFLNFGDGFTAPTSGPYAGLGTMVGVQPNALHDALVGTGTGNIVEESLGIIAAGTTVTPPYNMVSTASLINGFNTTVVPMDFQTLEIAITAQIQRALEPFDIQVISSVNSNLFNFPIAGPTGTQLSNATSLEALNNPAVGKPPQYGSDDVYIFFGGIFTTFNDPITMKPAAVADNVPISADFAVSVPNSSGGKPDRLDSGAVIDVNYFINRVLGAGGTGGSLNTAIANAAMYAIGWDYGLSEVENGTTGLNTSFFDPNVALINQSNAMVESGFTEGFIVNGATVEEPLSDTNMAFFSRYPMMQDGVDFQPLLRSGTLGNPPVIFDPGFPLPPPGFPTFVPPVETINDDPNVTVNTYDQLVNDPDIGANPDVAYVTGTGAFDQITITKLNATQAKVTVNSFDDNTYTNQIGTFSYDINLTKIVTPGRADDKLPFRVIVEGCTNDDQIFLDPTLGVNVVVHGGPDVKTLNITGNGAYTAQYTPNAPASPGGLNSASGIIAEASALIPEGLISAQAGTLKITGTTTATTITKNGKKTITKTTTTPFTTTVFVDHFNPNNASALMLDSFASLTYSSPGYLNNQFTVTSPTAGVWSLGGEVDSPFFPPALNGAVNFTNVKQLVIDTSKGASNDNINFSTGNTQEAGLQSVNIIAGTGSDSLSFDDSASSDMQNYVITPTLVLPTQPAISQFLGYKYSGVESLDVTGTQGNNSFFVTPSQTTAISIDGQDPPNGTLPPDGDKLSVRVAGTTGATENDDGAGNGDWTFASGQKPISFTNIENIVQPVAGVLVESGNGTSSKPLVKVFNAEDKTLEYMFYAYEQTFKGGVHVAVADVTGDGVPDLIVTPGLGRAGEVKVYDGAALAGMADGLGFVATPDAALVADFFPEGAAYKNGLYVAAGDLNGDTLNDFAVSLQRGATKVDEFYNQGGGVFNTTPDFSFVPYAAKTVNGAVIAAGDTNGDGIAEIVTAPGAGSATQVRVFDAQSGTMQLQFNAFTPTFRNGSSLAVGDLDGDGLADIVLGAGAGGNSQVQVFDATLGKLKKQFQAFTTSPTAAVRLAAIDPDGAGFAQIYVVQALGGTSHQIKFFDPLGPTLVDTLLETQPDFAGGLDLA